MKPLDQKDIISKIRSGDQLAFQNLFEKHYLPLVRITYHYTQDEEVARDLVQQVFIRFWEKREKLTIETSLYGYLRTMSVNEALGYLRTHNRRRELLDARPYENGMAESGEDLVMENELQTQIDNAVKALPDQCATVFRMSRYENMSYKEIAEAMKISPKTVENHIGKALKRLRNSLSHYLQSLIL